MCLVAVELQKMGRGPFIDSREASRKSKEEGRQVTESRESSITEVIISIPKAAETRVRKSFRERRTVKIKEKRPKYGALRYSKRHNEGIGQNASDFDPLGTPSQKGSYPIKS